ncbi:MAG: uroporphyrinogen decarboxylase family protein, partial [Atribacterota bacterium]
HVFPREPWTKIGETREGYPVYRDIWGMEAISTPFTYEVIKKPIEKPEDMKTYRFPTVDDFKYDNLRKWVNESDFFVVCQIETGFFKINQFMGFDNYMFYLYEHRKELLDFTARFFDHVYHLAQRVIQEGVDCVWLSNDFAYNTGPFISPQDLWELDFSFMKEVVQKIHDLGKPAVLHACGNQSLTLDMLVETGIDGLHALQPTAGNDLTQIKNKYGNQLCLIGNLDISQLLPFGSPYEVNQAVKKIVQENGKKNGLVITTCNLLDQDIPVENAITMHLAVDRYSALYL